MADLIASGPDTHGAKDDYSNRIASPYLLGMYLAVNAMSDAYILLDGPNCFPLKSPSIQGNHDWGSTLTDVSGYQRTLTTHAHPSNVVFSRRNVLLESIESIASYPGCGGVFVGARPMASLTGEDYDGIVRDAKPVAGKHVFYVPPKSLSASWLGGYEEVLLAIARRLPVLSPAPSPNKVAIVGYLFDRHEGDHEANLREIERYLAALGLEVSSVWLSGQNVTDLGAIRDAGTIISLPYGRRAARHMSERLGVPLVETCLPLGLGDSQRFVRDVARALGREDRGEALIEAELSYVVPKLEWVVPFVFQNADIGFMGDPNHVHGFADILRTLGANFSFAFLTSQARRLPPPDAGDLEEGGPSTVLFDPTQKEILTFIAREIKERGLDLIVGCNVGVKLGNVPILEFGFPSYFTHALAPRPFLGFGGCLALVDSMANAIRHAQFY